VSQLERCLEPPPPGQAPDPNRVLNALEDYATRHGVEVIYARLSDPEAAMFVEEGVAGVVGQRGRHHVALIDEHQDPAAKASTLAHELAHIRLELGPEAPREPVHLPHGQLEPRAYGAQYLFDVATGLARPNPQAFPQVTREVGREPATIACDMAQAVREYRPNPLRLTEFSGPR